MNRTSAKMTPERRPVPEPPAPQAPAPQPARSPQAITDLAVTQARAGNAALAAAATTEPMGGAPSFLPLQSVYGNAAVMRAVASTTSETMALPSFVRASDRTAVPAAQMPPTARDASPPVAVDTAQDSATTPLLTNEAEEEVTANTGETDPERANDISEQLSAEGDREPLAEEETELAKERLAVEQATAEETRVEEGAETPEPAFYREQSSLTGAQSLPGMPEHTDIQPPTPYASAEEIQSRTIQGEAVVESVAAVREERTPETAVTEETTDITTRLLEPEDSEVIEVEGEPKEKTKEDLGETEPPVSAEVSAIEEEVAPEEPLEETPVSAGAVEGLSGGIEDAKESMTAVRRTIQRRVRAMPTPVITSGTEAIRNAESQRQSAVTDLNNRRDQAPESARGAVPEPPQGLPGNAPAQEHPVPPARAALETASNRTLPNQTPPQLTRTPRGNLPQVGRQPLSPDLIRRLHRLLEEGPPVSDPRDQQRMELLNLRETLLTPATPREGEGVQAELRQPPLPQPPVIPPERRTQLTQVIARLMATPQPEASNMVNRARSAAFTNQVLNHTEGTENIGEQELVPDLTQTLTQQFHSIATEAGIADTELLTAVQQRQNQLAEERRREEERLQMSIADDSRDVSTATQELNNAIAGGRRAIDARAEAVEASAHGTDSAAFIRTRRDNLISEVTRTVATQETNYRRAGEGRQNELNQAERQQVSAYQFAVQQDEFQLNENRGQRTQLQVQEDVAQSRQWLDRTLRQTRTRFSELRTESSTATQGFRDSMTRAGDDARELIRQWAERQGGEERSFWDRLWEMINDWLTQTRANADAWQTVQNQETAAAAAGYLDMMEQVERAAQAGISQEQILYANRLNTEEQAIVRAYFDPQSGGDVISAVAESMRQRLYRERANDLKERIENLVLNGQLPWTTLEKIAVTYDSTFDAGARASQLYEAFHGGITGWGTNEEKAYQAMQSLNRVQAAALRAAYRQLHGRDLDSDITSEFSGGERNRARALMTGDQNRAAAAALYSAMHETFLMTGLGTDRDTIMNTLRGKSPEEIAEITRIYEETYPGDTSLRAQLGEELNDWATLTPHDAQIADAYLQSNPALADAIETDRALHGFSWGYAFNLAYGTSFEAGSRDEFTAIYDRVRQEVSQQAQREQWTDEQFQAEVTRRTQEIERIYNERYGLTWGTLRQNVNERFTDANRDLVTATLDNDQVRMDMARIGIERQSMVYASDDAIISTLEANYDRALEATRRDREPEMRRRMMNELQEEERAYFQQTGRRWTPEELYRRRQQLDRQLQQQLEAEARRRAEGTMLNVSEAYQSQYGETLHHAIESSTSNSFLGIGGDNEEHALTALQQGGYLTRYQRFDYAVRGGGTTEEAAQRALEGASHEELAQMRADWARTHPGETLDQRALSELSGAQQMDMRIALMGAPETVEERVRIERERVRLEQPTNVLAGMIAGPEKELMSIRLRQLDEDARRMQREDLSEEERERLLGDFDFHAEASHRAVERHREAVSSITDSITNAIGIAIALIAVAVGSFLTGGAAAAVALALLASLASTAASVATRMILMGGQYGTEELLTDLGLGVVDAAVAAATAGLGNRLLGISQIARAATPVTRAGLRGTIQQMQRGLGNLAARLGNVGPWTRRVPSIQFLARMQKGSFFSRLAANAISETVENTVGAIPTAVVGNVINDQNWKGGFQIGNVLQGIGIQVGQSAAMGLAVSHGIKGVQFAGGAALGFLRGPRLGVEPRLTTPDHLLLTAESYDAALREYQRQNPGSSATDFDAIVQRERAAHLQDYLAMNPGKTEADFGAYLRQEYAARRAEFQEMRPGATEADFDAEVGRESAAAFGKASEAQVAQQQIRSELLDAVSPDLQANVRDVPISRLSASEFTRVTGQLTGDVGIVVRDGQVHLVVREGASPAAVRDFAARLAEMVEPGTGGRTRDPAQALPRDLRNRVPVDVNPALGPGTVKVHFEGHDGIILGVWMEVGPGTRAIDIHNHVGTARAMRRLQGLSGEVHQLLNRIRKWAGMNVDPPPGTLAYEARLEVEKLPGIIQERASALLRATSVDEQLRIAIEIENLRGQLEQHQANVDAMEAGRGFVAAEALTQRQIDTRMRALPDEVRAVVGDMPAAERAHLLLHAGELGDFAKTQQQAERFIEAWRSLRAVTGAEKSTTAFLINRAAASADPIAFMDHLGQIARELRGADPAVVLDRISTMTKEGLGDYVTAVGTAVRSAGGSEAVGRIIELSTQARNRDALVNGLNKMLDSGVSSTTLDAVHARLSTIDIKNQAEYMRGAGDLAARINDLAQAHPQLGVLIDPLLQGSRSIREFSTYLENVTAFAEALAARTQGPNGIAAIQGLLQYAQDITLKGDKSVAVDLMTAGRQLINTPAAGRDNLINNFEARRSRGEYLGQRATWENLLLQAESEFSTSRSGGTQEARSLAQEIEAATPSTRGWTDGERGMIWQQRTWLSILAEERNVTASSLLNGLLGDAFEGRGNYDSFRQGLRAQLLERIFANGPDRPNVALLNRLLESYPDSGAKGVLFDRYMQQRLSQRPTPEGITGERVSHITGLVAADKGTHHLAVLEDGVVSHADFVVDVTADHTGNGGPPAGTRMMVDFKSGPGAFRPEQARQYITHLITHDGHIIDTGGVAHDGLIYIADSLKSAEDAMSDTQDIINQYFKGNGAHINLYFGYQRADGTIGWVRLTWNPNPGGTSGTPLGGSSATP